MKIYKEFPDIEEVAILVSWYGLEYETRKRFANGEVMRFLFCDYAHDELEYAIFADNDNNYYCVSLSERSEKHV